MLKGARGMYTDKQISRSSKMGGAYGKQVDRVFYTTLGQGLEYQTTRKRPSHYDADLKVFVRELKTDALFDYIPPREHSAFREFKANNRIQGPRKMGFRLRELSGDLDFWKRAAERRHRRH